MSKAESLLRRVRDDAGADLVVGVLGPGGCGKTALLNAVRLQYEAAGIPVVGLDAVLGNDVPAGAAVVLDDVHLLSADVLRHLTDLVGTSWGKVVIAFRPWPRPPALTALASLLRRRGPLTVLKHLDRAEVQRRASVVLGQPVSSNLLDLLVEKSAGHPMVLDEVLAALLELGVDRGSSQDLLDMEVTDRLRFVVDDIDGTTRALMRGIAAGANVEIGVLSELLELDAALVREAVETARASGFLLGDGRLIPLFRTALLNAEPVEATRDLQVRLLDVHAGRGHDVVPVARVLARSGIRNQRAAAVLVAAGDARMPLEPAVAAALYTDAVQAGTPAGELAVRRAEAALSMGDFDEALQLADRVIAADDCADVVRAIDVVATVMAHRGQMGRAADLYRWLGKERIGAAAPMAALALIAVGEPGEARVFLEKNLARRSPTMLAGAMASLSDGLQSSLSGSPTSALSALNRAATSFESTVGTSALLDSPAALTGLVAIHVGEFDLAESVLRRAIDQQGASAFARTRHLLLLAWIAMLRGQEMQAGAFLAQALPQGRVPEPRDAIFAAALDVGLARRSGDSAALARAWHSSREAILLQPIDLFVLLPLGEFFVAAAMMGESRLLDTQLSQALSLLDRLGNPQVWSNPLHWCAFQAAAVSESTAAMANAVQLLNRDSSPCGFGDSSSLSLEYLDNGHSHSVDSHSGHSHSVDSHSGHSHNGYSRALARAACSWSAAISGEIDAEEVQNAAAGLQGFGLGFEAALLLGEAATRSPDRRAAASLLHQARTIREGRSVPGIAPAMVTFAAGPDPRTSARPAVPVPTVDAPEVHPSPGAVLSGRELQVARLLLRNQTYREIGERLFISPKTVEHHVARMKQRIGASRRSDLFSQLRELTDILDA